jgi:DNA-binding transcriptional MerR regulator
MIRMTRARTTADSRKQRSRAAATQTASNGAERQIKIGEAARLIGVEAYVLRFWETQFPFLRPRHSRSKHRYYDQKSIETLQLIRRLLHSEGYTIAGAKKHIREGGLERLRGDNANSKPPTTQPMTDDRADPRAVPAPSGELSRATQIKLVAIREELKSLQKLLTR